MKKIMSFILAILVSNIGLAQVFTQDFSCSKDIASYSISNGGEKNGCDLNNKFDFISDFFKLENEAIVWEKQTNKSKKPVAVQVISRTTNLLEDTDFLIAQFKLKIDYTHTGYGSDNGQIYFYLGDGTSTAWQPTAINRPPVAKTVVSYNFLLNISTNAARFRLGGDKNVQLFEGEQLVTILLNRGNEPEKYYMGKKGQTIPSKTSHIWIGDSQITDGTKMLNAAIPKKFKIYIDQHVRDARLAIDDIKIWNNNTKNRKTKL